MATRIPEKASTLLDGLGVGQIADLDRVLFDTRFAPYYGWHDDHRGRERTPHYQPAAQQVRIEFFLLLRLCRAMGLSKKVLQIGLGIPGGTHKLFRSAFESVWTIERDRDTLNRYVNAFPNEGHFVLGDSHDLAVRDAVKAEGPFDLVFIDAGHTYEDVKRDFNLYSRLVKRGGIVALHDACKRPGYEDEIEVWCLVDELRANGVLVNMIGSEVGIAWLIG